MKRLRNEIRKQIRSILNEVYTDSSKMVGDIDGNVVRDPDASAQFSDGFLLEVMWKVIAAEGKSKKYNHVTSLDGGTVGIAHFASSGLSALYEAMGDNIVKKYFGKHKEEINSVDAIKNATYMGWSNKDGPVYCRVQGKNGRNPLPGSCYADMDWWVTGMKDFVKDPANNKIQEEGFLNLTGRPAKNEALRYGREWQTKRGIAIACCLINSNKDFLRKFSKNGKLGPNETMDAYCQDHGSVRKRYRILNKLYPDPSFKPKFKPESYT